MKVLLIDNNRDLDCYGATDLVRSVAGAGSFEIHVRRGPSSDFPASLDDFGALVISGSRTSCRSDEPWTLDFDRFLGRVMERKLPTFGVCYGHQSIARVLGGKSLLGRSKVPELGWTEIEIVKDDPIFEGLPGKFYSYSSHYEEVTTLSKEMVNLARSKDCAHQATRIPELGVYTIQFHPERSAAEGDASIEKSWKEGAREGILGRGKGKALFQPEVGERLFGNFFKFAKEFRP